MRRSTWTHALVVAATGAITLTLTGCASLLPGGSNDAPPDRTGAEQSTSDMRATSGAEPLNVAGTTATIDGNHVSTACFDFTTPDIGAEWVLHPEPLNCVADVNWPDSDQLTMIRVRAQTGELVPEDLESTFLEAGYESVDMTEGIVDGQTAYTFAVEDPYGLRQSIVIITLPEGRFSVDGTPLTAIFVGGYALGEGSENQVQQIVDSIEIH